MKTITIKKHCSHLKVWSVEMPNAPYSNRWPTLKMTLTESIQNIRSTQERANSVLGLFLKKYYSRRLKRQEELLDSQLVQHLKETNDNFRNLIEENLHLIANANIKFKVTDEGSSPWTYMTKSFAGKIHSNGFLYLKAKSNALEFLEILSHFYPSKYIGTMNALGQLTVKAAGEKFQIIGGRVPSMFIGEISREGKIVFETSESWFEIDGHVHVNKIIADPFKGNSQKRRKFLENRAEIRRTMNEWKIKNNVGQQRI